MRPQPRISSASAGEGHALVAGVAQHEAQAAVGVAWRGAYLQMARAEVHAIAMRQRPVEPLRTAVGAAEDSAAGALLQQPRGGDMVGMHMRLQRRCEREAEFAQQRAVTPHMLEHRIDQQRLAAVGVARQVGVGR